MIKQADENDIPVIEEILLDAVNWLSKSGMKPHRNKLRKVYENEGFMCVEEKTFFENHDTALYLCNVRNTTPIL